MSRNSHVYIYIGHYSIYSYIYNIIIILNHLYINFYGDSHLQGKQIYLIL